MILAALVLAVLSLRAEVFPEPLCENLPEVSPEVKTWVAQVTPELAQVRVRELLEKTALDVFRRAAAAGWGGIDVLTDGVFREPCTFHFSREALRAVDTAFDVGFPTAMRGQDRKGQDFEMAAILAGAGSSSSSTTATGSSTGTRGWTATSSSPPGSSSTRRLPVCSKIFTGSAPRSGYSVACASALW